MKNYSVPIEISARHVHLSQKDADILFGVDYKFESLKNLSQPGQTASRDTIIIKGPKGQVDSVRVIMPHRPATQVEIAMTDGYMLGVHPQIALSGDLRGAGSEVTLIGPAGEVRLKKGLIVAQRHLHISPAQAAEFGLHHLDKVSIKVFGTRELIFHNVVVRSRENIDELSFMIDTDEANAAGVVPGDQGELIIS